MTNVASSCDPDSPLVAQALTYLQTGQPAAAAALCERVLARRHRHFDALHALGVSRHQLGDPASAEKHLRAAIRLKPDFALTHINYGNALRELGRMPEALASYARATAIDPKLAIAHHNVGSALQDLGRHAEALASFERALALRPEAPTMVGRGSCLLALGRLDEAIEAYRAAIAHDGAYVDAHANLGSALVSRGEN